MSNKTTLGFLLTAVAAVTTGCPEDSPAPRPDVVDVPDSDVATDTPDADVPSDITDVPVPVCGDTRFIRPMADAVLGIADDADNNCSNGFTTSVQVATNALQGSTLELRVNGRTAASAPAGPYQYSFWIGVTGTSSDAQFTPFQLILRWGVG